MILFFQEHRDLEEPSILRRNLVKKICNSLAFWRLAEKIPMHIVLMKATQKEKANLST